MPFPCLIQRLCHAAGVEVIPLIDHAKEVTRTIDIGLIKADENPVAQVRAPHPQIRLPELRVDPTPESSIQPLTAEGPTQPRGDTSQHSGETSTPLEHTSTDPTPPTTSEAAPAHHTATGMTYISTEFLQSLVQRQTHMESQFSQLVQQLKPWVRSVATDLEERITQARKVDLDERDRRIHSRIDAFERRVQERFTQSQTVDLSDIRSELAQLRKDIATAHAPPPPLVLPPMQLLGPIDLFAQDDVPLLASSKRPRTEDTSDTSDHQLSKRERRDIQRATRASLQTEEEKRERERSLAHGAGSSSAAPQDTTRVTPSDDTSG